MLQGTLNEPETYALLTPHPVWQQALTWLHQLTVGTPLGEYELKGRELFASVQTYSTLARHEARFESHETYVDLQYTIEGGETIDWIPRNELRPDGAFTEDAQFWLPPPDQWTPLTQTVGRFAVFFPADAHRPKVRLAGYDRVRKVVIKIHRQLLSEVDPEIRTRR